MTEPLPYATHPSDPPQVSIPVARNNFIASVVPAPVGLLIVALCYGFDNGAVLLGLLWLVAGGLVTFVTAIIGVTGWAGTFSRTGDVRLARRYFGGAIAMAIVSCLAAACCVVVGIDLAGRQSFRVEVENTSGSAVTVVVHFSDGDVKVGPVPPHKQQLSAWTRTAHHGALDMTLMANGRSATTQASSYVDQDALSDPYNITVSDEELLQDLQAAGQP